MLTILAEHLAREQLTDAPPGPNVLQRASTGPGERGRGSACLPSPRSPLLQESWTGHPRHPLPAPSSLSLVHPGSRHSREELWAIRALNPGRAETSWAWVAKQNQSESNPKQKKEEAEKLRE